jgi:hypothetical protein
MLQEYIDSIEENSLASSNVEIVFTRNDGTVIHEVKL